MKSSLVTILLLYASVSVLGQNLGETDWRTEEDFRNSEQEILDNIIWLEENPFATDANDTKAITQYVLYWLTETPYVSVTLDQVFTDKLFRNKKYKYGDKLLITYLFGKSAYIIQNPEDTSERNASLHGVLSMIKVYEELLKSDLKAFNRTLEHYRDINSNGILDDYVREQLEAIGIDS